MKRALLLLLVVQLACLHVHVHTHGHVQGGAGLEPGDQVVARWHGGTLYPGIVITVHGSLVTVAWDDGSKSYVKRDQLAVMSDFPSAVSEGDWVLCQVGSWQVCQVTRLGNELAFASVSDGVARPLGRGAVVEVPEGLTEWVAEQGRAALELLAANQVWNRVWPKSAGKQVGDGQRVISSTDEAATWHEGTVETVKGDLVTVRSIQSGSTTQAPSSLVAAVGRGVSHAVGDLVLCKWANGARWWRAEVSGLSEDKVSITYRDSTRETLPHDRCTPAERRE